MCWGINEEVINIHDDEKVFSEEKTWVKLRWSEPASFESIGEVGKEVVGCLTKSVE